VQGFEKCIGMVKGLEEPFFGGSVPQGVKGRDWY